MFNFPLEFLASNFKTNLPLLQSQQAHELFELADYIDFPVFKQQKLDAANAAIVDPDVFFRKKSDFDGSEGDYSLSHQTTEVEGSSEQSPAKDAYYASEASELLTPQQSITDMSRKVSAEQYRYELPEEITTPAQLAKLIEGKITPENLYLLTVIERVLQGVNVNALDLDGLSSIEETIVRSIAVKKDAAQQNKKQKGKKREEEKQKFFFKGVLKFTEAKFFGIDVNLKKRMKKKDLKKEAYYRYYWNEVAQEHKIDLSNFFHPNKKLSSGKTTAQIQSAQNPGLKSLNTTYIDLILSSDKFKADTIDYLDNVFLKEASAARTKKICKLLTKLSSVAAEISKKNSHLPIDKQVDAIKSKVGDYLVNNPKTKLPWNDSELNEARDFAYGTILRQSAKYIKNAF